MRPGLLVLLCTMALLGHGEVAGAQDDSPADSTEPAAPAASEGDAPAADLIDADALDDLVAPVALYPDALLSQVLMAATVPLDVVKAERFIDDNESMTDKERADAAEDEDWDPSVQVLAGGFPEVIGRMADDIDWTEDLGDAMVAQTDDLLDAVQRMRAQAAAAGNLESNEAQTVSDEEGEIAIAPTDPDVIYVPTYDPERAYMADSAYVAPATGVSTTGLLTTGAIAFGTALLVDEIFDDDDDNWYGPDRIDWDDREIHVDRDVDRSRNVTRDVTRHIDRDGNHVWKPTDHQKTAARERVSEKKARDGHRAGGDRDHQRAAGAEQLMGHELKDRPKHDAEARARGAAKIKAGGGDHKRKLDDAAHKSHGGAAHEASRPKGDHAHKAPPRKASAKHSAFSKPSATARPHEHVAKRGHASHGRSHRR